MQQGADSAPPLNTDLSKDRTRRFNRLLLIAAFLGLIPGIYDVLRPSPQQQLAAIDKAHAIDDEDNAACVYYELLNDPIQPYDWSTKEGMLYSYGPRAYDFFFNVLNDPNYVSYLSSHTHHYKILDRASRIPACYFPLAKTNQTVSVSELMKSIESTRRLLNHTIRLDRREKRFSLAQEKALTLKRVGRHLSQQPSKRSMNVGMRIERLGLYHMIRSLALEETSTYDLDLLPAEQEILENKWSPIRPPLKKLNKIQHRMRKKEGLSLKPLVGAMLSAFLQPAREAYREVKREFRHVVRDFDHANRGISWICYDYHELLQERRGFRIVLELRRFKDRTGRWPDSLGQLTEDLPKGALIDPMVNKPFVYRHSSDSFALYGIGFNGKDDHGESGGTDKDDDPIWLAHYADLKERWIEE